MPITQMKGSIMRELNKNEFMRVKKGYDNALSLYQDGYLKEALLELKRPIRILEYRAENTRFLALCLQLQAKALHDLGKEPEAEVASLRAEEILRRIRD